MKNSPTIRELADLQLKNVFACELTNKTNYDKSRKMHLTCPVCLTGFSRAPSHVARVQGPSCCSRECASIARQVRFLVPCAICGKIMELTKTELSRIVVCSPECQHVRRAGPNGRKAGTAIYQEYANKLKEAHLCEVCGATTGPWRVEGLDVSYTPTGECSVNETKARVVCLRCHMQTIQPLAIKVKKTK